MPSDKTWFAKKSFPVVVFLLPLVTIYGVFLAVVPQESLNSKPTAAQFAIGMLVAVVTWLLLVILFSFLWALMLRLLYGSSRVRRWLLEESIPANGSGAIEKFMRHICELAL